jgi:8-oxo-dGTP pyrophosphatase MutT (NUDIX family)
MIMKHSTYYRTVEKLLTGELPGKTAQFKMAPPARDLPDTPLQRKTRYAGVLILLYPLENESYTILIRRSTYNGAHSGQISFPGGQYEASDKDLTFTALRETREEIGISPELIKVIGKLTPLYIPVSNYFVHPVVGILDSEPNFEKDPKEVEEIYSVKLESLLDPACLISDDHIYENERIIQAPYFQYNHLKIWGATAMILSEFIELHGNMAKRPL